MVPNEFSNIAWHSLQHEQAPLAISAGKAKRFKSDVSEIIAFENNNRPDFEGLARISEAGDSMYSIGWSGPVPAGWLLEVDAQVNELIWQGQLPDQVEDVTEDHVTEESVIRLDQTHVTQMLELVVLTKPGPFSERTIEMGDYFGIVENGQLIAMAGERLHAGRFREISGVCTRPGYQGRGLARLLMHKLIRLECDRNQIPFLHVVEGNDHALDIYLRMGFVRIQKVALRKFRKR